MPLMESCRPLLQAHYLGGGVRFHGKQIGNCGAAAPTLISSIFPVATAGRTHANLGPADLCGKPGQHKRWRRVTRHHQLPGKDGYIGGLAASTHPGTAACCGVTAWPSLLVLRVEAEVPSSGCPPNVPRMSGVPMLVGTAPPAVIGIVSPLQESTPMLLERLDG